MRFLFFALFLLSACNPLRPAKVELDPPPQEYSTTTVDTGSPLSQQWWLDFNDPQLNQLQQELFAGNLNLRQALYRLQQLEALQQISGSTLWPQLNLNGSVIRNHTPGMPEDTTTTSKQLSLAAAYEVDLWNRLRDKNSAAILRQQAGEKEVQSLLLSLSAQLCEQYFIAVEQRSQLKLLEQQSKHNKQLLQTITNRYRGGLSTAVEVYRAQQNLATSEARIPPRKTALMDAENRIALLLGQPPGSINLETSKLPPLMSIVDIGIPADLLLRRPDIAAALLQLKAADKEYAAAVAARLPGVNLTATLGKSVQNLAFGNIDGTIWSLAVGLTQPLVDGGRRRAESDRQKAIRSEKLAIYQQTLLTALKEVETALVAETNSIDLEKRLNIQQQINTANIKLTEANYRYGLTDSKDLVNSQIAKLEINSRQLSNQRLQLSHRISLARALGGGWMETEIKKQQQTLNNNGNK